MSNHNSGPGGPNNSVPPELDALLKRLQSKFGGAFNGGPKEPQKPVRKIPVLFWVITALVVWMVTGFYRVDEGLRGIELVFGKHDATTEAGLHFRWPTPIGSVEFVNVDQIVNLPLQTRMLTADENIVLVDLVVQYRRNNAEMYAFNVVEPDLTLEEVTKSAIRDVVGKNTLDYVLTEGLSEIGVLTKKLVQDTLDEYKTGILVTSVNMQQAEFPGEVQAAVKDAIKAREDKEAAILKAQAYRNDIVPRARGAAKQEIERAKAYKEQVIAEAEGEAERFNLLLAEYRKAPRVTRDRLYLETIEQVYGGAQKVVVDSEAGNNLLYLPLDKLIDANRRPAPMAQDVMPQAVSESREQNQSTQRSSSRSRSRR